MEAIQSFLKMYDQIPPKEKTAKVSSQYWKPPVVYDGDDDDDEERFIPLRDVIFEHPLSVAITHDLPITDSLIIEDEHLNTILKTESDKENESSVEDLVSIQSNSEDTYENDSDCDLPSCNNFSPINVFEEKSLTFSNPFFDSNDDCTSSDDESLSDEDVPEDKVKFTRTLFSNFSNDVNPLFHEVFENIERGVIDELDAFLDMYGYFLQIENGYHDSEGDIIYLESLLIDDTILNLPPEELLDHNPRSLKDEPDNDNLKRFLLVKVRYTSRFYQLLWGNRILDHGINPFVEIPSDESKSSQATDSKPNAKRVTRTIGFSVPDVLFNAA
ncbi:hypothetical protein Tco_0858596 [Tanacetum coccineum]|uniref:Uncharacterized protein n=1 Tax=Tanacetum coccineum TaxID=301880 RepID=A0ABQ5BBE3_9ASTR